MITRGDISAMINYYVAGIFGINPVRVGIWFDEQQATVRVIVPYRSDYQNCMLLRDQIGGELPVFMMALVERMPL